MKTLFLKNMMPVAVIALAVSGAFATTSMQSVAKKDAPKLGHFPDGMGGCSVESIQCSDTPSPNACQVSSSSPIAYDPDTNCVEQLYRLEP